MSLSTSPGPARVISLFTSISITPSCSTETAEPNDLVGHFGNALYSQRSTIELHTHTHTVRFGQNQQKEEKKTARRVKNNYSWFIYIYIQIIYLFPGPSARGFCKSVEMRVKSARRWFSSVGWASGVIDSISLKILMPRTNVLHSGRTVFARK